MPKNVSPAVLGQPGTAPAKKRVAIYVRVSTLDQAREGYSLAAQERALRKWCEDHGNEVCRVYADEGISGKDIQHRPGVTKLLADANDCQFDIVLVWALSRFSRSVADLYNTLALFAQHEIDLISLTEAFDTTSPMGRAMVGIVGVFAQLERELTGERVRAAMAERALRGKRTCNDVLGYDKLGKDSFVINPQEAEIVRYIFQRYKEYHNLSAVAELCELKGYRGKRGRIFRAFHVYTILTRPIYAGYNTFCGGVYPGMHTPIIPLAEYNKVQRLLSQCGRGRKNTRPPQTIDESALA